MAVPTFHITDDNSGIYGANAFPYNNPGTLLMDADAWLVSTSSTLLFFAPLTATINGKITASNFSGGGGAGIYVHVETPGRSSITVGTTGEVTGYNEGILSDTRSATDIVNKGRIVAVGPGGRAIAETFVSGDYSINNSGSIISAFHGIDLTIGGSGSSGGTHTIINSGFIDAPVAITAIDASTIEKVTNSGFIHGDVFLGNNADVFTDFLKVKKHGKVVTHHGNVDGIIDLGEDNDTFNGGNNAETVKDGQGADTYKLSGGNDTFLTGDDTGSDGVDTIDGGKGTDTYDGTASPAFIGGHTLHINIDKLAHGGIAANSVIFVQGGQTDHIFNFEDVIGSHGSDIIYGNASANHLVGGDSSNANVTRDDLFGLGGDDFLETSVNNGLLDGGDGNDILQTTGIGIKLFGGNGNDTLRGFGPGSIFDGGSGNDILEAGTGSSYMYGGAGADILTGGDNQGQGVREHYFYYKALSDSGVTAATRDVITKFAEGGTVGGSGDFIDVSAIDAITATKGIDDDFTFIGQAKWGHHAGELRYVSTADQTIVEADVNGDAKADFSIAINGHHALAATDFIL